MIIGTDMDNRNEDGHCCMTRGKNNGSKLHWSGNSKSIAGVEVSVAERWSSKILSIKL